MRESIGKLEAEQDRTSQRLGALEGSAELRAARPPRGKAEPARGAVGPVRTVQIGDSDDAGENDDPNDPNARPEIRLQGQGGGSSRAVRSKSVRDRDRDGRSERHESDDLGRGGAGDGASRASILDPEAKKSYEAALALVNNRQYDRGLEALSAFLTRWPDHPYAENAMYWRGEAYYARGEYLRAAEQFEGVLARGLGQKAPDALLKIGLCHDRLGSADRAKEYWDRLSREYPRSEAAKKIPSGGKNDRGAGPKESR